MAVLLDTNNDGTPESGVLNGSTALENIFWNGSVRGDIGPDVASILEETRIAMLCVAHLLTDDNGGESPVVQERIVWSCSPSNEGNYSDAMTGVARLVENIFNLTQLQASSAATAGK